MSEQPRESRDGSARDASGATLAPGTHTHAGNTFICNPLSSSFFCLPYRTVRYGTGILFLCIFFPPLCRCVHTHRYVSVRHLHASSPILIYCYRGTRSRCNSAGRRITAWPVAPRPPRRLGAQGACSHKTSAPPIPAQRFGRRKSAGRAGRASHIEARPRDPGVYRLRPVDVRFTSM